MIVTRLFSLNEEMFSKVDWFKATNAGDYPTFEKQLALNNDINIQDADGWTALMFASSKNHIHMVDMLLMKRADPNIKSRGNKTALICAAANGAVAICQLLIDRGANKEDTDNSGWTALMFACYNGQLPAVIELLNRGANIEAKSKEGWSPLVCAARTGKVEVVKELLKRGASIDELKINDEEDIFALAAKNGHHDVVKLLRDHKKLQKDYDDVKDTETEEV